MLFSKPFNWRTWMISYNCLECFVMPAFCPWVCVGNFLSTIAGMFVARPEATVYDDWLSFLLNFSTLSMYFILMNYEFTIRRATKILYGMQPTPYWRIIEFILFFLPGLFTCTVPTFVIAAFKVMLNKSEYNTAEKKISYTPQASATPIEQQATQP